jgi:hypothetical protein
MHKPSLAFASILAAVALGGASMSVPMQRAHGRQRGYRGQRRKNGMSNFERKIAAAVRNQYGVSK